MPLELRNGFDPSYLTPKLARVEADVKLVSEKRVDPPPRRRAPPPPPPPPLLPSGRSATASHVLALRAYAG